MITLKLPVTVDASVLKLAMQTAHNCNTDIRIETFFRIRVDDRFSVDCDNEHELKEYARHAIGAVPQISEPSTSALGVPGGGDDQP